MTPNKTITLVGPFTEEDEAILLAALRVCERKQPDYDFGMVVNGGEEKSIEDVKRFMMEHYPTVEGIPVSIEVFEKKQEKRFPQPSEN